MDLSRSVARTLLMGELPPAVADRLLAAQMDDANYSPPVLPADPELCINFVISRSPTAVADVVKLIEDPEVLAAVARRDRRNVTRIAVAANGAGVDEVISYLLVQSRRWSEWARDDLIDAVLSGGHRRAMHQLAAHPELLDTGKGQAASRFAGECLRSDETGEDFDAFMVIDLVRANLSGINWSFLEREWATLERVAPLVRLVHGIFGCNALVDRDVVNWMCRLLTDAEVAGDAKQFEAVLDFALELRCPLVLGALSGDAVVAAVRRREEVEQAFLAATGAITERVQIVGLLATLHSAGIEVSGPLGSVLRANPVCAEYVMTHTVGVWPTFSAEAVEALVHPSDAGSETADTNAALRLIARILDPCQMVAALEHVLGSGVVSHDVLTRAAPSFGINPDRLLALSALRGVALSNARILVAAALRDPAKIGADFASALAEHGEGDDARYAIDALDAAGAALLADRMIAGGIGGPPTFPLEVLARYGTGLSEDQRWGLLTMSESPRVAPAYWTLPEGVMGPEGLKRYRDEVCADAEDLCAFDLELMARRMGGWGDLPGDFEARWRALFDLVPVTTMLANRSGDAISLVARALREALGDDTEQWETALSLLGRWGGTVADLIEVTAGVSRAE